jgi:hypothetical protein
MATAKKQVQEEENKKFVFTSKNIAEITEQIGDGVVIKRYQNPWFKNEVGVRRSGISFGITTWEWEEYFKCAESVQYFAENYCQIKREDGSIGPIRLRDYQRDILDLYENNRVILCASRQSGKCSTFNTSVQISENKYERIGIIYYNIMRLYRKLTFLEKVKIKMYNFIYHLDNKRTKI